VADQLSESENQRHEVYKWLLATDPSSRHYLACDQYEKGTGDWMLRSTEWQNWIERKKRCLWIHGIPGAGKTILASHLIETTKKYCKNSSTKRSAYLYYYCYFGHNQDEAAPFLKWAINRLCREADQVPDYVYQLYKHGGEPSIADLMSSLEAILEEFQTAYIIIDAIDESQPRNDLLRILRDLATDHRFNKVQLLATSREYVDIESVLQHVSESVSMMNPLVENDIRLYVKSQMDTNPRFKHWSVQLRKEVINTLATKAKGM
jgi:NACHT domain